MSSVRLAPIPIVLAVAAAACASPPHATPDAAPPPAAAEAAEATTDGAAVLAELGRVEAARWDGVRATETTVRMPMGEVTYRLTLQDEEAGRRFETSVVSMDLGFPVPPDMDVGGPIVAGPAGWDRMEAAEVRWEGREDHDGRVLDRIVLVDPVEETDFELPGFDASAMDMTTSRTVLFVDRAAGVVPVIESAGEVTNPETGVRSSYRFVQRSSDFRDVQGLRIPWVVETRMEGILSEDEVRAMRSQMQMMEGMLDQMPAEDRPMMETMIRMFMETFREDGSIVMSAEIVDLTVEREG